MIRERPFGNGVTNDTTRRAVLAAALAAGTGGLAASSAADLLGSFAPLSGEAWDAADRSLPETVTSPHGDADVRVDGHGVPHVAADDEAAAYFAVGYLQAFNRLFAMDLQRRVMRGRLSEAVGASTVESDEFHVVMGFAEAAEATWDLVSDTPAGPLVEAFADGVNAAMDAEPLPLEFALVGYAATSIVARSLKGFGYGGLIDGSVIRRGWDAVRVSFVLDSSDRAEE